MSLVTVWSHLGLWTPTSNLSARVPCTLAQIACPGRVKFVRRSRWMMNVEAKEGPTDDQKSRNHRFYSNKTRFTQTQHSDRLRFVKHGQCSDASFLWKVSSLKTLGHLGFANPQGFCRVLAATVCIVRISSQSLTVTGYSRRKIWCSISMHPNGLRGAGHTVDWHLRLAWTASPQTTSFFLPAQVYSFGCGS